MLIETVPSISIDVAKMFLFMCWCNVCSM